MTGFDQQLGPDRVVRLFENDTHEEMIASFDRLEAAEVQARKRTLRVVREVAAERPGRFENVATPLVTFLTDDDRAVRLTTAKLFVALARSAPEIVQPVVDPLAERVADHEEFYYVRARAAEGLGYVALECPDAVGDPEIPAEFRLGLSFDEPEVREKLAKALSYVALGEPRRLRHQVPALAEHLDSRELVRYHLCTALLAVGCNHPEKLAAAAEELRERYTPTSEVAQPRPSLCSWGLDRRSIRWQTPST